MNQQELTPEKHPTTNETVIEVCKRFKVDRRCRPFFWNSDLVCNQKVTLDCSGCNGGGCHECGYTGKRVNHFPNLILSNEQIVKKWIK